MLDPGSNRELPPIPAKRYFTIGEVSELCDVKPHVLRYWETEFPSLNPVKRRGNRRYYQRHEVLMVRQIRGLLYEQGYTIGGARLRLEGDDAKDESALGRLVSWNVAWNMIKGNPIWGVGFNAFIWEYHNYTQGIDFPPGYENVVARVAHNSYFQIWAECGSFAFITFMGVIMVMRVPMPCGLVTLSPEFPGPAQQQPEANQPDQHIAERCQPEFGRIHHSFARPVQQKHATIDQSHGRGRLCKT